MKTSDLLKMQAESLCEGFEKNQKCVTDCLAKEIAELKEKLQIAEEALSLWSDSLEKATAVSSGIGMIITMTDELRNVAVANLKEALKKIRGKNEKT